MKFDGKAFAQEIEAKVSENVAKLSVKPRIVSVLVGDDPASALYTKLKKAAAERVGIEFEIVREKGEVTSEKLKQILEVIGQREDVTGMMVQLPLPGDSRKDTEEILAAIPLDKDVDGLRYPDSGVVPPVVKAKVSSPPTVRLMTVMLSSFSLAKVQVTCSPGPMLTLAGLLPSEQVAAVCRQPAGALSARS